MEGGRTSAPHWRLRAGRGARLRPRPDAAPPKNGENNGRGRPICGLPLDHRRSKSDCDWTPVEDEGDHTPSTDLNSASPIPTVTGAQHLGVQLHYCESIQTVHVGSSRCQRIASRTCLRTCCVRSSASSPILSLPPLRAHSWAAAATPALPSAAARPALTAPKSSV